MSSPLQRPLGFARRTLGRFVPDLVWYNWKWDLAAGISSGIYQACIWTFALQLARGKMHAGGIAMGLATAAPAIGYLFAIIWARQMEGRSKLPFVTVTWVLSRGLFLLTPLVAQGPLRSQLFVSLLVFAPIIFSVSTPAYTAIMKDIYPDHVRGRMMAYVRVGMNISMLITAFVMGNLQEHYGLDFRWMFFIGGIFGVGTAYAFSKLKLPEATGSVELPPLGWFLKDTFSILITNKGYRWFTTSVFITGFGNLVATTYYPIYQVDHFHILPTQIATMQNLGSIMSIAALFFWGWYMDRFGPLSTVLMAVFVNCLTPLLYAFGGNIYAIYFAAIISTTTGAGINLGYLNTTLTLAEPGRAAQYQAVHSSFFGLRGTIAPLIAIRLLEALGHRWVVAFEVCLGIMLTGVVFQFFSLQSYRQSQRK